MPRPWSVWKSSTPADATSSAEPPPRPADQPPRAAQSDGSKRQRGERGGANRRAQVNYMLKRSGRAPLTTPPGQGHLAPSQRSVKEQLLYQLHWQIRTKAKTPEELLEQLHRENMPNLTAPFFGACIH